MNCMKNMTLCPITSASTGDLRLRLLEENVGRIDSIWIVCEVVTITVTVVLAYAIIRLAMFQIRYCKRKERTRIYNIICGKRVSYENVLFALTMCSAILAFVRCFTDIDLIFGRHSELNCKYLKKPKIFIAFMSLLFQMLTYWTRQRIFYTNEQLKQLANKLTRFVSTWILGGLGLLFVAGLSYFMIQDVGYRPLPPYGCSESNNIVPFVLLWATIFSSQITLALLLVYPIFKKNQLSSNIRARPSNHHGKFTHPRRPIKFMSVVRKTFATALLGAVSTTMGLIVETVLVTYVDNVGMAIADVILTVLVLCAVVSNVDCKNIFLPFYRCASTESIAQTSLIHTKASQRSPALLQISTNCTENLLKINLKKEVMEGEIFQQRT